MTPTILLVLCLNYAAVEAGSQWLRERPGVKAIRYRWLNSEISVVDCCMLLRLLSNWNALDSLGQRVTACIF